MRPIISIKIITKYRGLPKENSCNFFVFQPIDFKFVLFSLQRAALTNPIKSVTHFIKHHPWIWDARDDLEQNDTKINGLAHMISIKAQAYWTSPLKLNPIGVCPTSATITFLPQHAPSHVCQGVCIVDVKVLYLFTFIM